MDLYINDNLMDTTDDPIAVTYQANDLGDISSRQVSFSTTIEMPKTERNIANMELLGIPGSVSTIPYRKTKGKIVDDGFEQLPSGAVRITETAETYKAAVYEEVKDLFETLSERLISQLDFSAYNHNLTVESYLASFTRSTHYIYAEGLFFDGRPNIGYNFKMPSLFVHSLFQDILTQAGYSFEGDIFANANFRRKVVTPTRGYENTVRTGTETVFQSVNLTEAVTGTQATPFTQSRVVFTQILSRGTLFRIGGSIDLAAFLGSGNVLIKLNDNVILNISAGFGDWQTRNTIQIVDLLIFSGTVTIELFGVSGQSGVNHGINLQAIIGLDLYTVDVIPLSINFSHLFGQQTQLDFLKEIMVLNNLVFRQRGRDRHLIFRCMGQVLVDRLGADDWSEKFIIQKSESYNSGYAQNNIFEYKYENDVVPFADGNMPVRDENLPARKVVHSSIFTAPLHSLNLPMGRYWETRRVDERDTIVPRNETFRIYDLNYSTAPFIITLRNVAGFLVAAPGTRVPILRLQPMIEYIVENYSSMKVALDRYKKVVCSFNLNFLDIHTLDFYRLKYVSELGKYFYLNKINNFLPDELSSCEMIEAPDPLLVSTLDVIPPTNIHNFWADQVSTTSLRLRWSESFDNSPVTYEVYQGGVLIHITAALEFPVSGLVANTEYRFSVRARDVAMNFSAYRELFVRTTVTAIDITPPARPTGLTVGSITSTGFTLGWAANVESDLHSYRVYFNNILNITVLRPAVSAVITGLNPNTAYSVFITAVDNSGNESLTSTSVNTTTLAHIWSLQMGGLGRPTDVEACNFGGAGDLFWHRGAHAEPVMLDQIFTDSAATIVFDGGFQWYKTTGGSHGRAIQINNLGFVISISDCGGEFQI